MGNLQDATNDIDAAVDLAHTIPDTLEFAPTLLAEAELYAHRGDFERGLLLAQESLTRARPLEQIAEAQLTLAGIHLSLGNQAEAAVAATEALARATQLDSPRIISLAHLAMAEVRSGRADPEAVASFDAALRSASAAGTPYERAAVLQAYAQHLERVGTRAGVATAMAAESVGIQRQLGIARDSSEGAPFS
jgi:tetratricopeptide (TPR) repeat protein